MHRGNAIEGNASDDAFALRLSAFFVTTFMIVGCYMPFLPLWLDWRGLSDFQISLIYAVPVFIRVLFIPAMSFAADHTGRPVSLIRWLALGAFLSILMLPLVNGFPAIFTVVLIFTLFWMSVVPLTDAVALAKVRAGSGDYGRMRLWGSLGFVAMTSGGGALIELWGPRAALWLFIAAAAAVLLSAQLLPSDRRSSVDESGLTRRAKPRLADMGRLMTRSNFWFFLAAAGAIQAGHAVYYIFGTLHWTAQGLSSTLIGALWTIGVVAEIALFAYGARVNRWFGPAQLLVLAGLAAVLRWTVTAYNPPLAVLFAVQALHGLTFGAAHLGAMQFLTQAIPSRLAASAQGLYASITASLAMGLASLAAGPLYRNFAGEAYLAMAALGGLGFLLALVLMRRWQGGTIIETAQPEANSEVQAP